MHILVLAPPSYHRNWKNAFDRLASQHQLYSSVEEALPHAAAIEVILLWKQDRGSLHHFPNVKVYYSMGAGVDHILSDPSRLLNIPICRVVDPYMANDMGNFLVMAVLNYHRRFYEILENQRQKHWDHVNLPNIPVRIGIMGMGHLGQAIGQKLHQLQFPVFGFSQKPKTDLPYPCYSSAHLEEFLAQINVLLLLLPATPATVGWLNRDFFQKCSPGTYLINVARGPLVVTSDLIQAVDSGQLSGALLDVFPQEPLPAESPLWTHPKIQVTPHIASITAPETAAEQIFKNLEAWEKGSPLAYQIDPYKGY